MLQKKKINTVSKVIQNKTCHRQAVSDTMADKAIEYSKTIYSGCDKDDIEVLILQRFIKKLKERGLRSKMILQVHDELNFKCHHEEIEELKNLVVDCMEHVVRLAVPLTVGTGYGKSWYEAH